MEGSLVNSREYTKCELSPMQYMEGLLFDGNAAFSGGGFMPSQTTQGTDPSSVSSKNRDAQSLLPLTVKQIYDAFQSSDDKVTLTVDGVDVNTVTLIGRVCNKAGRITDVTFVLDDGTGKIECQKWFQEAADINEAEPILDGMYVRLHGHLKNFQGKKTFNIFSFRPVTDFNEVASHFIDCIHVHLYNSRVRSSVPSQQHVMNSTPITHKMGYQSQVVPPTNQFSDHHINGQKSVENMVLDFLHLPTNRSRNEGVHRDLIAQHLEISLDKLMVALKNLIDEGAVYETIADHYKSIINVEVADYEGASITCGSLHHNFHRPLGLVPEMARGNRALPSQVTCGGGDTFFLVAIQTSVRIVRGQSVLSGASHHRRGIIVYTIEEYLWVEKEKPLTNGSRLTPLWVMGHRVPLLFPLASLQSYNEHH
ncbi:unnamed protein product [Sphenostylis stenocarpa]|uniref:Replication protein A 32 kDa subunit n=1 Tax=Sphenostylis stenocarpa TaxID=92480 RepID=A0AA86SFF2_9FABA|nr:unnamed protein product [Sphenostylis stenocarpa]